MLSNELELKITDFFTAWFTDRQQALAYFHTDGDVYPPRELRGTEVYMPPEVNVGHFSVDRSLDVFSFAHLTLFVLLQASAFIHLHGNYII